MEKQQEMKQYRITALVLLMVALMGNASAQTVSPVDFMRNNPRNMDANPAFFTSEQIYFDLALGGINFHLQNIGFKYDNFFRFNEAGKPVAIELTRGVESLRDINYLNTYLNIDVFRGGLRTKHGFFTYCHRIREMESLMYNKDLVSLVTQGNSTFMGEDHPAHLNFGLSARVYQEFNFGYQMCLTEKLNIGARVKLLMGLADAKFNENNSKLITDPETYAITATGSFDLRATLPYQLNMDDGSIVDGRFDVANLFKNYGAGLDLGAEYKINDQFGVAASINDLGYIKWNNYSARLSSSMNDEGPMCHDGAFVFDGLTSEQINGFMDGSYTLGQFLDTLSSNFNVGLEAVDHYTTGLNTTVRVMGYYDLNSQNRFSVQFMGYDSGLGFRPALTLAYTGSFVDLYDVVATYTMMPGSFANLGLGLSGNFDGIVIYAASNNVFGFVNPANISNVNLQFGISFALGKQKARSERVVMQ